MVRAELGQRIRSVQAVIDRSLSNERQTSSVGYEIEEGHIISNVVEEVCIRGGRQVGFRKPDGGKTALRSRDIVHEFKDGKVVRRFKAGNPPKEYIRMSQEELKQFLESSVSGSGGMEN